MLGETYALLGALLQGERSDRTDELLSPALRALLSPDSGISRFGRDYNIYAAYTDSESFYLWLFGGKKPLALLPRQTSLQRAVAAHLEQGGYIGSGYGIKK